MRRYLAFVDRFIEWAKARPDGLRVQTGFLPSYDCDLETFQLLSRWFESNIGSRINWIPLGGLTMRGEEEMRRWLGERQEVGLVGISGTFVGHGAVHDRWNGRRGDFDFLMQTIRTGIRLGLKHTNQHLVIKDSLPLVGESIAMFDELPAPDAGRSLRLPFFIGHSVHHETQRLDEGDRANLPKSIIDLFQSSVLLRSEREWIDVIQLEDETPVNLVLRLELDTKNIGQLEKLSCEDIFIDLESRARATLSKLPSKQELARSYADPSGNRIYTFAADMDRRWIHRFLEAKSVPVDHKLLHYHLGGSFRPPRLWELPAANA